MGAPTTAIMPRNTALLCTGAPAEEFPTEEPNAIDELKQFNTPQITNVVGTYPGAPTCLSLYNPWRSNWYTDSSIKCIFPELGRTCGYAVTCVFGVTDPNYTALSWCDVLDVLEEYRNQGKPTVLMLKHDFPADIASKVGLVGGNMATHMKTLGCRGVVCDGPARDFDEIRPMDFQLLCTGASPGHGSQSVQAIQVPVNIGGMDVAPGEIVHMDEHGATKFPANKMNDVIALCKQLQAKEDDDLSRVRKCKNSAEIRAVLEGHAYGEKNKKQKLDDEGLIHDKA